jgi:hypothetical protein
MKNALLRFGFVVLMTLTLSLSAVAQGRQGARGARGDQPQGQRGGQIGAPGPVVAMAEQRKAVQEKVKAAIQQENSSFRHRMQSLQADARASKDANERYVIKTKIDAARLDHQAALSKIRSEAQAAMAAFRR